EHGPGQGCGTAVDRQHSGPYRAARLDAAAQRRPGVLHLAGAPKGLPGGQLPALAGECTVLDGPAPTGKESERLNGCRLRLSVALPVTALSRKRRKPLATEALRVFRFLPYIGKSLWRHRTRTVLTVSGSAV